MKKNLSINRLKLITVLLCMFIMLCFTSSVEAESNVNPFAQHDAEYVNMVNSVKDKSLGNYNSSTQSEKSLLETAKPRYIVKFNETVSLTDIACLLKGYDFELIGKSDNRLFIIHTNDGINSLRTVFGEFAQSIDSDTIKEFSDFDVSTMSIPNDTYFSNQWYLNTIKVPQAWDIKNSASNVYVAVIDSGGRWDWSVFQHIDLQNADIRGGYNFAIDAGPVNDDISGHASKVIGVIAAESNNNMGIAGIAQNVVIVPLCVEGMWMGTPTIFTSDVIKAIFYAADSGCQIINLSLGSNSNDSNEAIAIQYAYDRGCIIVASAGNSGINEYNYPASYPGVISVGSINSDLNPSSFTTYNSMVDIAAPGSNIMTTIGFDNYTGIRNTYGYVNGTSFSAPCITGIAALALSCDPDITPAEFETLLKSTAKDIYTIGTDYYTGAGVVDAQALLSAITGYFIDDGVLIEYLGDEGQLTVPYDVKRIGNQAFLNKSSVTNIILPDGLTSIGESAFSGCTKLVYIDIPKEVESIGDNAFHGCSAITRITIPDSVTLIADNAFSNCGQLTIYCQPGSYAEVYAIEHSIPYSHEVLLRYQGHVQNIGWQYPVACGEVAGTSGLSYRVEALKVKLINVPEGMSIEYRGHVQNIGWMDWVSDGEMVGTSGQSLRVEALEIRLVGTDADKYSVMYQAHVQNIGWQDWVWDGQMCGTSGQSLRVEAIRIKIVEKLPTPPSVTYRGHVQNIGWMDWVSDGQAAGTSGMGYRVEALNIQLENAPEGMSIEYRGHVQNIGWMDWVSDGEMVGTSGRSLRVEALEIRLVGTDADKYSVMYQGHVQNIGWQDWVKDGQMCGTSGQSLRVEAIRIKIVPKVN